MTKKIINLTITPSKNSTPTKQKKRAFSAASLGRNLSQWQSAVYADFNREISTDLLTLRQRSRDFSINNPYMRRYLKSLDALVIGRGMIPKFMVSSGEKLDEYANRVLKEEFSKFEKHATVDNQSLKNVLSLCLESVARDGEVLVLKHIINGQLKLQLLPSDYLPIRYNAVYNDNQIISGVEINSFGVPVAYWIHKYDPNNRSYSPEILSELIRYTADQVIHLFKPERIGQYRGFPWTAAVLEPLYHLDRWQQSYAMLARVAAAKGVFYTKPQGESSFNNDEESPGEFIETLDPGSASILPEGYNVQTVDFNTPGDVYQPYVNAVLCSVATGLNMPVAVISADYSQANYSSLRASSLVDIQYFETVQQLLIEKICIPVFETWLSTAIKNKKLQNLSGNFERYNKIQFIPKHMPEVDPSKTADWFAFLIEHNLASKSDIVKSISSQDYVDVVNKIAREKQLERSKFGIDKPTENDDANTQEKVA